VRLPAAAPLKARERGPGAAEPERPLRQRVLIVDDNRDAAESLSRVLQMLGADVRVAHDGPEALEAFRSYQPAVVLLDIGMLGMDGYEVARRLRADFPDRRVALVAMTGWGQEEDRRRAREAGFDHHLTKPADMTALQTLLVSLPTEAPSEKEAPLTT
jgi:CheY-like chemotaxis protein